MPAEVKILIEGYTNADSVAETGEERTQPTVTLVRDGDLVMVIDPGILESQQVLVDALKKEDLTVKDVDIVCITHSHIDHYRNIGMFPEAKILEHYGLWDKNGVENWSENFSQNIQILHTPGHDYTSLTIFVTTSDGIVAICGDVFWKENYPKDAADDAYALDAKELEESRKMILKMADWIIPGHGGIYKSNRNATASKRVSAEKSKSQNFGVCRKCQRVMKTKLDSCRCRPYLCHHDCECGLDCDLCGCSHKK